MQAVRSCGFYVLSKESCSLTPWNDVSGNLDMAGLCVDKDSSHISLLRFLSGSAFSSAQNSVDPGLFLPEVKAPKGSVVFVVQLPWDTTCWNHGD